MNPVFALKSKQLILRESVKTFAHVWKKEEKLLDVTRAATIVELIMSGRTVEMAFRGEAMGEASVAVPVSIVGRL